MTLQIFCLFLSRILNINSKIIIQKAKELDTTALPNLIVHTQSLNLIGLNNNGALTQMIYKEGVIPQRFQ